MGLTYTLSTPNLDIMRNYSAQRIDQLPGFHGSFAEIMKILADGNSEDEIVLVLGGREQTTMDCPSIYDAQPSHF